MNSSPTPQAAREQWAGDPRCVPKLCGADVELSSFVTGLPGTGDTSRWSSRAVLREIEGIPGDAREVLSQAQGWLSPDLAPQAFTDPVSDSTGSSCQDWGRKFLFNGGCAYIDLNHPEMCLPEVRSARDHVAWSHALYRIAAQAAQAVNDRLDGRAKLHLLANNCDGHGHSYGSHLNFLLQRRTWEDIFHRRLHYLVHLASYQASSIVFTVQGKVGSDNDAPAVAYQLAQRPDHLEVLVGPQTTYRRPLVNSRDEALTGSWRLAADERSAHRLARLHVICYDHNLCHVAAFLKVGVLQVILAMLEAGEVDTALALEDPVGAVRTWSHDPTLHARARLLSGRELTAIELQSCFLEAAQRFVAAGRCEDIVPDAEEILRLWGDTLEHLKALRLEALAPRLDWVLKFTLLQQASAARRELAWHSPELRHLDQIYASLDPAEGLYWACERSGLVQRLVPERQISRAMQEPPPDTRAWTRAALLLVADPATVEMVDWDFIRFRLARPAQAGGPRHYFVSLADPLRHTRSELSAKLPESGTFEDMLQSLDAIAVQPLDIAGSQFLANPAAPVLPRAVAQADSQSAGDLSTGRNNHD